MEKRREDAQPERSETASAPEGDHGDRFSRGTVGHAAEPEPGPHASTRDDWPYPYDTSAVTRPTGSTSAADGTRRMPVRRGPEGMPRDPWQEDAPATAVLPATPAPAAPADNTPAGDAADAGAHDASAGQTHGPHEVTIQLDAVQIGNGVLLGTPNRPDGGAGPEPSGGPPEDRLPFASVGAESGRGLRLVQEHADSRGGRALGNGVLGRGAGKLLWFEVGGRRGAG